MKNFLRKNKISVIIGAILLVFTVLLCIPATIRVFAGVFGYAAYFYLALGYVALVLKIKNIRPKIEVKRLVLYILTGLFVLLTLHVGIIGKSVAESGFGGYIGATYERATVGGVVLSVVSCPLVLTCKYIASVVIFFVLAATGGFLCIAPFLFERSNRAKKKKEKPAQETFVPPVIEEEEAPKTTPPAPVDEPVKEPEVGSREYAYRAIFGTDMPKKDKVETPAPAPAPAPKAPSKPKTTEEKKAQLYGEQPTDRYRIVDDFYATVVQPDDSVYTNNYLADQRRKEARDKLFGVPPSEAARLDPTDRTVRAEVEEGIRYNPYVPTEPLYDSADEQPIEQPEETPYTTLEQHEEPAPAYEEPVRETSYDADELPTVQDSEYLRALNAEAGVDAPRSLHTEDFEQEEIVAETDDEVEETPIEEEIPIHDRFSPIRPAAPAPEPEPEPEPVPEPEPEAQPKKVKTRKRKKYNRPPETIFVDRPLPPGFVPYVANLGQLKDVIENQSAALGLSMTLVDAIKGPTVTYCTVALGEGCQVKKVQSVAADLALKFHAVGDITIIPQIPGTPYIGIEIPNDIVGSVSLKEVLLSDEYKNAQGDLIVALGKYSRGEIMVSDLAEWPHALIAGSSGSGKSVCLNAILTSLVYRYSPFDLQLILIDKKKVELMGYNGLPHMLFKEALYDDDDICKAIVWLQKETERRFDVLMSARAKKLSIYNAKVPESEQLPRIVLVIDEANELMTKPHLRKAVEPALGSISRIGRACGVHMIFATQTPTRDVITSEIQNNFNTKIAFHVNEYRHSMVILGSTGAETLRGHGDMLYMNYKGELFRGQGLFVDDDEIDNAVEYIITNNEPEYDEDFINEVLHADKSEVADAPALSESAPAAKNGFLEPKNPSEDESFLDFAKQVLKLFVDSNRVSATYVQRKFSKGYNTIANVMDYLEDQGYITPQSGNKRNLIITKEQFYELYPEMRDVSPDDPDGE